MAEERRDQLKRMREEGARRIAELDLPKGCDLPTLCERLGTILFVVDRTNTKPGTSGRIWMSKVVLAK